MAKHKLNQVSLVTDNRPAQPPFPGGWVLAIFGALSTYVPDFAQAQNLPGSDQTRGRIKRGKSVKQSTYDEMEAKLVSVVEALFPKVSKTSHCVEKYVKEYFGLWLTAAKCAPPWEAALGFDSGEPGVLARALLRDLVLRVCYLESAERALEGVGFSEGELSPLRHNSPAGVYEELIADQMKARALSQEKLAEELRITDRSLRRLKTGRAIPSLDQLRRLTPPDKCGRIIQGIGFIDHLLGALRLRGRAIFGEVLKAVEEFLPRHRAILESFTGAILEKQKDGTHTERECRFREYIAHADHLLLHPGFESLHSSIPSSLWRCHLYALAFARMPDLARAYSRFSTAEHDRDLERFLDAAEREPDNSPFRWMNNLGERNNIVSLPNPDSPLAS